MKCISEHFPKKTLLKHDRTEKKNAGLDEVREFRKKFADKKKEICVVIEILSNSAVNEILKSRDEK